MRRTPAILATNIAWFYLWVEEEKLSLIVAYLIFQDDFCIIMIFYFGRISPFAIRRIGKAQFIFPFILY
jgi:hypothetical protein